MKKISKIRFVVILLISLCCLYACRKDQPLSPLHYLYGIYKNGEIGECKLNGEKVYCGQINAADAETIIYDGSGKIIGTCNYAWGKPDTICFQLQSCETVYRCRDHMSGQPFIDKYGLSK